MTGAGEKLSFACTTDREPDTLEQHIVMVLEAFLTFLFGNLMLVMSRRYKRWGDTIGPEALSRWCCRHGQSIEHEQFCLHDINLVCMCEFRLKMRL
jgi:hypothetical protein